MVGKENIIIQGEVVFPLICKIQKYITPFMNYRLRNYSCSPDLPFLVTLKIQQSGLQLRDLSLRLAVMAKMATGVWGPMQCVLLN